MSAPLLADYTSSMWSAAMPAGYDAWRTDMPDPTLCDHCSRDVERGEPHADYCPGHPNFLDRAEGIAQAALAGLFVDFGLPTRAVTVHARATSQGVVADVRVFMTYPQIEEAA